MTTSASSLSPHLQCAVSSITLAAMLLTSSPLALAQTAVGTGTSSVRGNEPVTLNFANAEIEAVARTMATITGRNVVVDPRVKGQLTLITERAVPPRPRSSSSWPHCACRASRWLNRPACTRWCPRPTPSCKAAAWA